MENFKLDLTQLEYVREENRVQGNWYIAVDNMTSSTPWIVQWHSNDRSMDAWGGQSVKFNFWLQIPPNLPGFPKAELPDEFVLKQGEHEYYSEYHEGWMHISAMTGSNNITFRRTKPTLPELTIPSGTRSEQIEAVRKILEELETK